MSVERVPIAAFVAELEAALNRGDGYIMGARGQNPRTGYLDLKETRVKSSWKPTGWYYAQYSGSQRAQALRWRERCARVWDCNGMAEGVYELRTGVCIDSKARYNYADWCSVKGKGVIPAQRRVAGAAVFWGNSAGSIHHVAYLYKPVKAGEPQGDWYLIEARGVMYGVVKTKLSQRKPDFWGLMDKYYDYSAPKAVGAVRIEGGQCYVRALPDPQTGAALGVAARDSELPWLGETSPQGWQKVLWNGGEGWVSGKYGKVVGA